MRRMVFLAIGVAGLLVALSLAGLLTVRRVPRLTQLTPVAGVVVNGPTIRYTSRTASGTLDLGWCAGLGRPLAAGQPVTAFTDTDALGRVRVWRIEQEGRAICRFAESTAAVTAANRPLRVIALAAAAVGLLAFAGLLLESWRAYRRS
ncbi:MAG: hypothetical protein FJZ38_11115 [Candidatus Rokubacteria bacterium]|nr:hypothetical protein [Candidatus Rokubacteria bacterium]